MNPLFPSFLHLSTNEEKQEPGKLKMGDYNYYLLIALPGLLQVREMRNGGLAVSATS